MPRLVDSWFQGLHGLDRLHAFFDRAEDPWDRIHLPCPPRSFGSGSTRSFADYFHGASQVTTRTLEDVCAWLRSCQCRSDHEIFQKDDVWQHPLAFEQVRVGDCEDHALWAWRKLAEIRIPARFTAGRWGQTPHAWILLDLHDGVRLLETTAKGPFMIHPLNPAVRSTYCPALSIDHSLHTYVHAGYRHFHHRP